MQLSQIPRAIRKVWASSAGSAFVRSVPDSGAPQGQASYDVGFPPETFTPIASGGTPPAGQDFNGVLADLTAWARWVKAGGAVLFDADFATAVGGYPSGAVLTSTTAGVLWQNQTDSNTTNPDSSASSGWLRLGGSVQDGQLRQTITAPGTYRVTFPVPFPNACTSVVMSGFNQSASDGMDSFPQLVTSDRTGFSFVCQWTGGKGTSSSLDGIDWMAKGY